MQAAPCCSASCWPPSWRPTTDPGVADPAVLGRLHSDQAAGGRGGDFLDKPLSKGGLELSRYSASFTLLAAIAALVLISTLRNRQPVRAELDIEQ